MYHYTVEEIDPELEKRFGPISCYTFLVRDYAELAAMDFYYEHEGNKLDWPLTFVLFERSSKTDPDDVGTEYKYKIKISYRPEFRATKITPDIIE